MSLFKIKELRLTNLNCDSNFQSTLRDTGDGSKYKESLRAPYEKKTKIVINREVKTEIFNNEYKRLEENVKALRDKYMKHYVLGTLRSNITTSMTNKKDESNKNSDQRFSQLKLKGEILKENPEMTRTKRKPSYERFYNSVRTSKYTSENPKTIQVQQEKKNPIRSLSVAELNEETRMSRLANTARTARVSSYMGSEQLKRNTFNDTEKKELKNTEKINNKNFVTNLAKHSEPKKYKPHTKYIFDKNVGSYG